MVTTGRSLEGGLLKQPSPEGPRVCILAEINSTLRHGGVRFRSADLASFQWNEEEGRIMWMYNCPPTCCKQMVPGHAPSARWRSHHHGWSKLCPERMMQRVWQGASRMHCCTRLFVGPLGTDRASISGRRCCLQRGHRVQASIWRRQGCR